MGLAEWPRPPVVPNRFEGGPGVGAMFGSSHTEPFRRYDWRCRVRVKVGESSSPLDGQGEQPF